MSNFRLFQEKFCSFVSGKSELKNFSQELLPVGELTRELVLEVYKNDYTARMKEALGSTFEVTWEVLGDESFYEACDIFISQNASTFYSLGEYGAHFSTVIKNQEFDREVPFSSELADFEWSFWQVFHSRCNANFMNLEQLNHIISNDLALEFLSEVEIKSYSHKVGTLWQNRSELKDKTVEDFEGREFLIFGRSLEGVRLCLLTEQEYMLIDTLMRKGYWSKSTEELDYLLEWQAEQWARFFDLIIQFLKR